MLIPPELSGLVLPGFNLQDRRCFSLFYPSFSLSLSRFLSSILTQRFDGVLLRLLLLAPVLAGHQRRDGERVGPGGELRLRGGRVLHGVGPLVSLKHLGAK